MKIRGIDILKKSQKMPGEIKILSLQNFLKLQKFPESSDFTPLKLECFHVFANNCHFLEGIVLLNLPHFFPSSTVLLNYFIVFQLKTKNSAP